ncbi:Uncharacterized protein EC-HemY in Proteobacteria (unrelated to HemY-type PPO in GramPositives) [hydrothermal vent metagenome]|uniref:Uncharacterized protein EC-HemY in Proteobacteria (Unrelated to HemY-type PPO in GramPositives) n=1 Tax=hydrothermal vent metagenome TaxID=652676 RepID=A0A3B1APX6_9ZZZZ
MIKLLIVFLIVLLLSVFIGLFANHDTGYVLIGRGYYTVELSLTLYVVLQLASFMSLYAIIRVGLKTWHMPTIIRRWKKRNQRQKAHSASNIGLMQLAQGQWKKAENTLIKSAKNSETPLLNYLSAARAAQKRNAPERRDEYLELAQNQVTKNKTKNEFAIQITQAELQIAHGQFDNAKALLKNLKQLKPNHPQVLFLLFQLYSKQKDFDPLLDILPHVRKLKLVPNDELTAVELELYRYALKKLKDQTASEITKFWKIIPKNCQKNDSLFQLYAHLLIDKNKHDAANNLLKTRLKISWNEDLILLYGDIASNVPVAQLEFAETFLNKYEKNHCLLLTLGKLAKRCELWGKARSYLEASIGSKARRETYRELGALLEQLGEYKTAAKCFRDGLFLDQKITIAPTLKLVNFNSTE